MGGWASSLCALQASALDPAGPVTITIDLGGLRKLTAVAIQWEFPAKSYTISVSTDGTKWSEVHATDSNVLSSSSVALGYIPAKRVKVVMHEAVRSTCYARTALPVCFLSRLLRRPPGLSTDTPFMALSL